MRVWGAGTSLSMLCVIFLQFAQPEHNCSICTETRYHHDKLTFWLLCLTSAVMSFRWELFSPCRRCGLFDKTSIAVLLTQTCGLQAFFLVTQHFGCSSFLSCFNQVLADLKQIYSFLVAFESVYLEKGRAAWGLQSVACYAKWIYNLLLKDFISTHQLGLIFMYSNSGWDINVPRKLSLLYSVFTILQEHYKVYHLLVQVAVQLTARLIWLFICFEYCHRWFTYTILWTLFKAVE